MSYFKAVALITSATFYTAAINPPLPHSVSNALYKGRAYEHIVQQIANVAGATIMIPSFFHSLLLVHPHTRSLPVTPFICPTTPPHTQLAALPPSFLAGLVILLSGAFIRLWSYHILWSLFAKFEAVIEDEYSELVIESPCDYTLVTEGPYAHVRHPAYTGLVLLTTGAYLMHFGAGGYVTQCGIENNPVLAVFGWSWRISSLFGFVSLYRRCGIEDEKSKTQFGAGWVKYSEEVPYTLVPYVM